MSPFFFYCWFRFLLYLPLISLLLVLLSPVSIVEREFYPLPSALSEWSDSAAPGFPTISSD